MIKVLKFTNLSNELKASWDKLWESSSYAHYFNSVDWFETCIATFNYNGFCIFTVTENGKLLAVLPLVKAPTLGVDLYQSPGGAFVDRSSLLISNKEKLVLKILMKELVKMGNFCLQELPEDVINFLPSEYTKRLKYSSTNYYLPFEGNKFRFLSPKNRKRIENKIAENKNYLRFKQFRNSTKALTIAMSVDSSSARELKGMGTFSKKINVLFFEKLLEINKKNAFINILYFDKTPIVYDIGILSKGTYHGLNTSYLPEYKKLMPGKLLTFFLLQKLEKLGVKSFDFNRGEGELKRDITKMVKKQYDLIYISSRLNKFQFDTISSTYDFILKNKVLYSLYCHLRKNSRQLGII